MEFTTYWAQPYPLPQDGRERLSDQEELVNKHTMTLEPEAVIRPATPDDVPKIVSLISPFVSGGKLLPRTVEEVCDLVPTGFVAQRGEIIVGFAALEVYSKKLSEIRSLAVSPDQQKQGLGTRLVKACVELATRRNILEVMVVTSSEAFFRDCGFDFTLPGEKKALFIQPTSSQAPAELH
jgi:amino-acid N-acetyltransferase